MKKLTIALLMSLAFNNASVIKAGGETNLDTQDTPKTQVQAESNVKKDLAKGLAGLAGAGIFGYLSYKTNTKTWKHKKNYNNFENIIQSIYKFTGKNIIRSMPKSKVKSYLKKNIGIVGNALIAFQCAKYGAGKIGSVIAAKTPASVKEKLSSIRSTITGKVQANWKRPFSWVGSKLRSKINSTKRVSEISNFDAQIEANAKTK